MWQNQNRASRKSVIHHYILKLSSSDHVFFIHQKKMNLGLTILLIGIVACHMTSAIQWKSYEDDNQPETTELPVGLAYHLSKVASEGARGLSSQLFKIIAKTHKEDLVFTPTSVFLVLGMAGFGARHNTAYQLVNTLGLPPRFFDRYGGIGFEKFIKDLNFYEKYFSQLVVANKIFISNQLTLKSEYVDLTDKYFHSKVQSLDFSDVTKASNAINAWSDEQTNHNIKDVIRPENLEGAKIVLINAVYFRATWANQFDPQYTVLRTFYAANDYRTEVKRIQTMYAVGHYHYGVSVDLRARFVYLPFDNFEHSDIGGMFVLLPYEGENIADVEKAFNHYGVYNLPDQMKETKLELTLPKFDIENRIELSAPLEKMGVTDIFNDNADLSGMVEGSSQLKVSVFVQNAMIKVDEWGVTAAGVTGAVGSNRISGSPPTSPVKFHANRPFISIIVSSFHRVPLFISRYTGL